MRVSVLVPTHQRREHLRRALLALAAQTVPPDAFEVVVSVDGSTDGTVEMLRELALPYRLVVREGTRRGRAGTRNDALAAAVGEVAVLIDDDMEPAPDCLAVHLSRHDAAPRLCIVGTVPIRHEPDAPPVTRWLAGMWERRLAELAHPGHVWRTEDFYSGHFSIRRDVLHEVGGFDVGFTEYGYEDVELALRLRQAGVTFRFAPDAVAFQTNDKAFAELARDERAKGRTAVRVALRHPDAFAGFRLAEWDTAPPAGRAVRALVLAFARRWPAVPSVVVRAEAAASRWRLPGLARLYPQAHGLFFWLGVRDALVDLRRERPDALARCAPLARVARIVGALPPDAAAVDAPAIDSPRPTSPTSPRP